jgi:tRNA(His) 5'-end guanylyltransferase
MQNDDLGKRMKQYESVFHSQLPKRIPVICRIDGRSFHAVSRKRFGKSWNMEFVEMMIETVKHVQKDMQGCDFVYSQSDEASFLLVDYRTIRTNSWFDYDVQKLTSISASLASAKFSQLYGKPVSFDGRVFSIPADGEVVNYFIWRSQDCLRNAVQMAGQEHFSPKQLHGKSCNDIQEMLFQEHGINFNDYPTIRKRGFCIVNGKLDNEIPIFTKDRHYIQKFVDIRED